MILITYEDEIKELEYPTGNSEWSKLTEYIGNDCSLLEHVQPRRLYTRIGASLAIKDTAGSKVSMLVDEEFTYHCDDDKINKISDYISNINTIFFYPDDLNLIKGNPEVRRRYLNIQLSQLSSIYFKNISDYNKLLKIRNDYLKKLDNHEKINQPYFDTLTDYIVEKSVFIYQMRHQYIEKLNKICGDIYKNITGLSNFEIKYIPSINYVTPSREEIQKIMREKLNENIEKEIILKTTIYGPHKDDFEFSIDNKNLKNFGSQGQQRAAVLTLKLSEIKLIENYKKSSPIILLDDVFSELDQQKINNLLSYIDSGTQVIITTTDLDSIRNELKSKANLLHIINGKIENEVQ